MRVHKRDQRYERARAHLRIGIEHHHVTTARQAERLIVRRRKPAILHILDQMHIGKLLAHHRRAVIARGIVNHKNFESPLRTLKPKT